MNRSLKALLIGVIALSGACTGQESLIKYVDPQIGTAHSRWFFYTPAAVPFGMAKPSPTTNGHLGNPSGWEAIGYDFRDSTIEGFACFHEFQIGGVVTEPKYVDDYQKGQDVRMYFSAILDRKPLEFGGFVNDSIDRRANKSSGKGAGFYLTFNTQKENSLNVKVGLSYTSTANAEMNLRSEADDLTFDKAKELAQKEWEEQLGIIRVEGGKEEDKVKFYTGLFHAILGRGLASDVDGSYPKNNGEIGKIPLGKDGKPVHNHYNTDAIWGAFWNLTQLWSIAYPDYFSDWISSQLLVYKDSGWLGDGIACSKYVSGVGTNFVSLAIAAAYNCGIRDFDIETAYQAARKNELDGTDRPLGAGKTDVGAFVKRGFVPYDDDLGMRTTTEESSFSVSHTLEYCFSSYAVAQMAEALGHKEDSEELMRMSDGWRNVFDKTTRLMRPKDKNGAFITDFDPHAPWIGFQEGNAIQYTYYVPHNPTALIEAVGREEFNDRLDSSFVVSQESIFGGGKTINAFSGLQAYYNHGNQPNLHISGMFNFSGKPWLSQKWMRAICNEFYGTEGIHGYGYGQDEDQGQLGAWYVMASIGLFDVRGLTSPEPSFQIVFPLFDKITIQLDNEYFKGKTFEIKTKGETTGNVCIQSLKLNGKILSTIQLPFQELTNGGTLEIELGKEPNTEITY